MGVDIHMYICKDKRYIKEDIFDGRNSSWFANLQQNGDKDEYDSLAIQYGISEETPLNFSDKYKDQIGYYGYAYIKVEDFLKWYINYRPDKDAGWVTKYEAWAYKNKKIYPNYLKKFLSKDDIIENMEFIEVIDKYDCSSWLYSFLLDNKISKDAIIQYCFDR